MVSLAEKALRRMTGLEPFPQPSVIPVRYPVVMMHGFGLMASLRKGGHYYDQAQLLRQHGVWAYAPNVTAYDRIPVRAEMWKLRFNHVLEETGASKLNLIAHSMGGLDARYLISTLGWHDRVASLTTISAPHHGTPLAEYLMRQPEQLQNLVSQLADWAGSTVLTNATSDFARAVKELDGEYVESTFNPANPDHPSVQYWSYAGRAGKGTDVSINPFLRLFNRIIYDKEGENDGYVSTQSARWGTFVETIDADHLTQLGLPEGGGSPDIANQLYLNIAHRLHENSL